MIIYILLYYGFGLSVVGLCFALFAGIVLGAGKLVEITGCLNWLARLGDRANEWLDNR